MLLIVLLLTFSGCVMSNAATPASEESACAAAKDCSSCIGTASCAWCIPYAKVNATVDSSCIHVGVGVTINCNGTLDNPTSEVTDTQEHGNDGLETESPVNITPKRVKVKLRVGDEIQVPLSIHVAKNQHLDLYYLTDISNSMKDDLENLKSMGEDLENALSSLTTRFAMGFGTFVDKKMGPYYNIYATDNIKEACHSSMGFCNAMALKENGGKEFNEAVGQAGNFTNLDSPEGGFEALMQVIRCYNALNWRQHARKIVVYASDATFHYAGDGKLAGIDAVNDEACHLDVANKIYTHSHIQDYPSVAQIGRGASEMKIRVIFAVTQQVKILYDELSRHIDGSSVVALSADSSNIIKLITEQYNSISSAMSLTVDNPLESVQVRIEYNCPEGGPDECRGLELGTTQRATAFIKLTRCPAPGKNITGGIKITSPDTSETTDIELEYICSCDCQQHIEPGSSVCNGHGSYSCGQCRCDENYYGNNCRCAGQMAEDLDKCKKGNDTLICSGKGECSCGECKCHRLDLPNHNYQGKYCECSNFDCEITNGKLCNGHGVCDCNKCICEENWTDDRCSCHNVSSNCIQKLETGELVTCSGRGECVCNTCVCSSTGNGNDEKYFGRHCQDCPTCGGLCKSLSKCVECFLHESGDKKIGQNENTGMDCGNAEIQDKCKNINSSISAVTPSEAATMSSCSYVLDGCSRTFYYKIENLITLVYIDENWHCPIKTWVIVLTSIAATVLVGLIILAILFCIKARKDRIEFEKLQKESEKYMNSATNENRLYRNPNTLNQNPLYGVSNL